MKHNAHEGQEGMMAGGSSEQWDWSMGDLVGITRYLVLDGGFCPSPSVTEDCTRSGVGEADEQRPQRRTGW